MVVLTASICTRGGKAVLSRQFRAMSKSQVEVLLSSFPRFIDSSTQHTTIEAETVRYVYQPLEELLYMVLITTKGSNILQDIETLHLFAQVVSSICRADLSEQEIARNAFELLSAFDEIVCLGYRENLTLPQVRSILDMESHEEKIQEIIARNKEHEASEERKRRARQLEMQRREMAKFGPRESFGQNFRSQYQPVRASPSEVAATTHYDNYKTESFKSAPSAPKGKGMSLGKKSNTRLYDALSNEIVSTEELAQPMTPTPVTAPAAAAPAHVAAPTEGIIISVTENTTAKCDRDGGVDSMDIQGQLNLHISDTSLSRIQIELDTNDSDGTQFKTHPNVDRNLFKNQHKIGLRDSSRPFPLNQQMSILRWRLQAKSDTTSLPISVNSWPSPVGDGTTDVNIEYEIDSSNATIENVAIIIPLPILGAIPQIREIDGDYQITSEGFVWRPSTSEVENGRLEFNVAGDDTEGFFPVEVRYNTAKTICSVDINDIKLVDMNEGVEYEKTVKAETVIHIS